MQPLHKFSPAKINLYLHITAKRKDGYHDLDSVFRILDFGDDLYFYTQVCTHDAIPKIVLEGASSITTTVNDNLIIKAAHALMHHAQTHNIGTLTHLHIRLHKRIPMGAGLGGGSSNAATTLLTLNELWQLNLSLEQLCSIAATLGADVPFFIFASRYPSAHTTGIGDVLSPLPLPPRRYLLLTPDTHISTAALFTHPSLKKNSTPLSAPRLSKLAHYAFDRLPPDINNVFSDVVCATHPEVLTALSYLRTLEQHTLSHARMTGTGSVVFLPITPHISNHTLRCWQTAAPCTAYIAGSL